MKEINRRDSTEEFENHMYRQVSSIDWLIPLKFELFELVYELKRKDE